MPWNYVDKEILRSNIFLFPTYFQIKLFYWSRNPSTIHWIVALQDMVWKLDQDPETRDLGTLGSGTRDPPPSKFKSVTWTPLRFKSGTPAGAQPWFFYGRGGLVGLGHFYKHFVKNTRKKGTAGKNLGVFTFWIKSWTQSRHFLQNQGTFLRFSK